MVRLSPITLQCILVYNYVMTDEQKWGVWLGAGFVILAVALGIIALVISGSVSSNSQTAPATVVPAIADTDWVQGNKNAKLTITEYGDFECPACRAYEPLIAQILNSYNGKILFAFRNFPLYQIHPNAEPAAKAAEAAGLQGKYWQMHALLYSKQTEWTEASPSEVVSKYFNIYAQTIGIDVNRFDADMDSSSVAQKIARDSESGNKAKIDHTPTFFINNIQITNPTSYDSFKAVIDAALASANK